MSIFKRRYTSEKPYELQPGKHYICEIQIGLIKIQNIRSVIEELEAADIHLHVVFASGTVQALDMKVVREESN